MDLFSIRNVQQEDRDWIRRWLVFQWGAEIVISHDVVFTPADLMVLNLLCNFSFNITRLGIKSRDSRLARNLSRLTFFGFK